MVSNFVAIFGFLLATWQRGHSAFRPNTPIFASTEAPPFSSPPYTSFLFHLQTGLIENQLGAWERCQIAMALAADINFVDFGPLRNCPISLIRCRLQPRWCRISERRWLWDREGSGSMQPPDTRSRNQLQRWQPTDDFSYINAARRARRPCDAVPLWTVQKNYQPKISRVRTQKLCSVYSHA